GDAVNSILLSAGAACIVLGIVGGGAKAFGVEVPILTNTARQAGLAIIGLLFLLTAYILRDDRPADASVAAYRQAVQAVRCTYDAEDSRSLDYLMATKDDDGTYDRAQIISGVPGTADGRPCHVGGALASACTRRPERPSLRGTAGPGHLLRGAK